MKDWIERELERLEIPIIPSHIDSTKDIYEKLDDCGDVTIEKREVLAVLERERQVKEVLLYNIEEVRRKVEESEELPRKHPRLFEYITSLVATQRVLANRNSSPVLMLEAYVHSSSDTKERGE